jgi:hypothetical protein
MSLFFGPGDEYSHELHLQLIEERTGERMRPFPPEIFKECEGRDKYLNDQRKGTSFSTYSMSLINYNNAFHSEVVSLQLEVIS